MGGWLEAGWPVIARKTTGLGEHLTDAVRAVARQNPRLSGVIDVTDFNATTAGQRIVDDGFDPLFEGNPFIPTKLRQAGRLPAPADHA